MNAHPQLDANLSNLHRAFGPAAKPITKGGVVTIAAGVPMTAQNLAALEAAWRFDVDAPKVHRA